MSHIQTIRVVVTATALIVVLAACQGTAPPGTGETGGPATTVDAPAATTAPEPEQPEPTSAPPATSAPAESEGEGIPPEAVAIGLGILVLFLLIGWLMGRSRKSTPTPVAAVPVVTWRDHAREGYSEARWLYDGLSEDLAIWRGNALFEGATDTSVAASTALAETWAQLGDRANKATEGLYRAEAGAPDPTTAETIRNVVAAIGATRAAVDARAQARLNSRGVDPSDQSVVGPAAERERLASENLNEARRQLNVALTALSTIT